MTGTMVHATARQVLEPYIQQFSIAVSGSLPQVLADAPDSIHQTRIATRRLRSLLSTYRPLWTSSHSELRGELRWYAALLSRPRDLEVVGEWLTALIESPEIGALPGVSAAYMVLNKQIRQDRETALTGMSLELSGERFKALVAMLPPQDWSPGAQVPADLLVPGLAALKVRAIAAKAASLPTGLERPLALHELRKAAKAARYAIEVFTTDSSEHVATWKKVTDALGLAQDAQVARSVLDELRQAAPGHRAVWDCLTVRVDAALRSSEDAGLEYVKLATTMPDAHIATV